MTSEALSSLSLGGVLITLGYSAGRKTTIDVTDLIWKRAGRDQGKPQQAHELLAPVCGWFTEGFDTLDLKEAKALLEELAV